MNAKNESSDQMQADSLPAPSPPRRGVTGILSTVLAIGLLVYAFCLFKNISYPLMWADESMTAVGAQRVLTYGYPKVHDGRNVFYDLRSDDMTLGIDKKTDAYIGGAGWGHYYFAAPFVVLSQFTSDLYLKTAILRIPFALAGLAGLLLLLWTGIKPLEKRLNRLLVAAIFLVLELPCVTLMLHLREVRYYSLQLLLTAFALNAFTTYHLFSSIRYYVYAVAVVCLVPLLFLTFSPASLAFSVTVGLYLGGECLIALISERRLSLPSLIVRLKPFVPVIASLALVVPLAWFFRTLYISRRLEEFYNFSFSIYLEHLNVVWGYFVRYDIILFAVAIKLLLVLCWRRLRSDAELLLTFKLSLFLSLYFIAQVLIISKIPNTLFTRYFIMLQPLLVLSFTLDLLILALLSFRMNKQRKAVRAAVLIALLCGSVGWVFSQNLQLIKGRLYEVSHQYRGPLDFIIPYIKEHYELPSQLVIATNYEETSYIYYLGCRVIIGFLNPDLPQDLQQVMLERPDCIVYRKCWPNVTDMNIFNEFLRRDVYEMEWFPVLDYCFNNIPEAVHWTPETGWQRSLHFFHTVYVDDPNRQTILYLLRQGSAKGPVLQGPGH
jgi:hypothetical protein